MKTMMILAGGEATRLGPLAAQMNKALVSIKQRPILAHHVQRGRELDVDQIVVVCDETSRRQLERTLELTGCEIPWRIVIQAVPLGPVDAIMRGLTGGVDRGASSNDDEIIVTAADTFIDPAEPYGPQDYEGAWAGMMTTDNLSRSWSYWRTDNPTTGRFDDGQPSEFEYAEVDVFIGCFKTRVQSLRRAVGATIHEHGNRVLMAPLLNKMEFFLHTFAGWHDTGDVAALAEARRATFTSRAKHTMTLDDRGIITKTGVTGEEMHAAYQMARLILGPRVFGFGNGVLELEHVDLPSLAELWLYWPSRPETWVHIVSTIIARLNRDLWYSGPVHLCTITNQTHMYIDKPEARLHQNGSDRMDPELIEYLKAEVIHTLPGRSIHGDMNFGNILYGLGTDIFRLIDARGDFGGASTMYGDERYDIAKMRFSWRGFTAITHGLDPERVNAAGSRPDTIEALDDLLVGLGYDLKHLAAIEATMYLSSLPLHAKCEQGPMYYAAMGCMKEALS